MSIEKPNDINERRMKLLIAELMTCFTSDKYRAIMVEKVAWLTSIGVKVACISNRAIFQEEKVEPGGKVTWSKPDEQQFKTPLRLSLNILDFKDAEFAAIFLHETGHIEDKDNPLIKLGTVESEISAWHHAIRDLNKLSLNTNEKNVVESVMIRGLRSYQIDQSEIDQLTLALV